MAKGRRVSKKTSIKQWKKGINNQKNINLNGYSSDTKGGIRLA